MATIVYHDGFETGAFSIAGDASTRLYDTVNGPPTSASAPVYSGRRSMQCATSGSVIQHLRWTAGSYLIPSACDTLVLRFKFRIAGAPSADLDIFKLWTGSFFKEAKLTVDSSLGMKAYFTTGYSSETTLSANTWYTIHVKFDTLVSPWTFDWRVNDTAMTQRTSTAEDPSDIVDLFLGGISYVTATTYFDDLVVSRTAADYPLTDNYRVGQVDIRASGTHNVDNPSTTYYYSGTPTQIAPGETSSWENISDLPISGSSDYVYATGTPNSAHYVDYQFHKYPYTPTAVRVVEAVMQGSAGGGSTYTSRLYDGTSSGDITTAADINSATEVFRTKYFASPPSGGSWTNAQLNAMRYRFGFTADASPDIQMRSVMAEALYIDSDTFPTKPVLDTFNRTNEEPITGWQDVATLGGMRIVGNVATGDSATWCAAYWLGEVFSIPAEAYTEIPAGATGGGIAEFFYLLSDNLSASPISDDNRDGYRLITNFPNTNELGLYRLDNNSATVLRRVLWTFANNDSFGVSVSVAGVHTVYAKRTGGNWVPLTQVTDSTHTSGVIYVGTDGSGATQYDNVGGGSLQTRPYISITVR